MMFLSVFGWAFFFFALATASQNVLEDDAVILITGAAGFVGSEVALALLRLYQDSSSKSTLQLVLIDSLLPIKGPSTTTSTDDISLLQELKLFEYKRQRLFRVLQEEPSGTNNTQVFFYKVHLSQPTALTTEDQPKDYNNNNIIHHIFQKHKITHCLHLEMLEHTAANSPRNQIVTPRYVNQPWTRPLQTLIDQIILASSSTTATIPLIYASTYQVYSNQTASSTTSLSEETPITQPPMSMYGASKLLDEILVSSSSTTSSMGLRFFPIYGPWDTPSSFLYQQMMRMSTSTTGHGSTTFSAFDTTTLYDYMYIDDAVNAVLAALQASSSLKQHAIFNIGTGKGYTHYEIGQQIQTLSNNNNTKKVPPPSSTIHSPEQQSFVASTQRQEQYLGYTPQVSLSQGLKRTYQWHQQRAHPYPTNQTINHDTTAAEEQLFPCASECANQQNCLSTFWDDVLEYTQELTQDCSRVLYTVDLQDETATLPSAFTQISPTSKSHFQNESPKKSLSCNIAFVSSQSALVQKLLQKKKQLNMFRSASSYHQLQEGFWKIVPVAVSHLSLATKKKFSVLPVLSPGLFFPSAQVAIYTAPTVLLDNADALVEQFLDQVPSHPPTSVQQETLLLVIRNDPKKPQNQQSYYSNSYQYSAQQEHAYRSIRIALSDYLSPPSNLWMDPFVSVMVHKLQNIEDGRIFRCDAYGEVVQWKSDSVASAYEFIVGLHDMWSNLSAPRQQGWWARSSSNNNNDDDHRILQEMDEESVQDEEEESGMVHNDFGIQQDKVPERQQEQQVDEYFSDEELDESQKSDIDEDSIEERVGEYHSSGTDTDNLWNEEDRWMGILTSKMDTQYFARIVSLESIGAVNLEQYFVENDIPHGATA